MEECDTLEYRKINNNKIYCYTDACPEGKYAKSDTDRECVLTCGSGFYKTEGSGKICVELCETAQFAEITDSDGLKKCVDDCSARFFEDAKTSGGAAYRQCVEKNDNRYFTKEGVTAGSTIK